MILVTEKTEKETENIEKKRISLTQIIKSLKRHHNRLKLANIYEKNSYFINCKLFTIFLHYK